MLARGTVKGWVWWAAVLLVLASLAGRAFALWLAGDRVPLGDPFVYQSLARNLLAGRGLVSDEILELPNLRAFYPPGYPLLLAGIGLVLPLGAATYAVLNTAIDAAASLLIAKVGGEVGDRKGGRIAGLIYFAWPTNIFLAPLAYKEGLVALLMLAVIVALFASARGSGKGTIGFGLATGALVLVQPALAALAPLIGLALRPRFPDWRTWARRMALAASITALVMLPWWVRNYLLFDRFIPMTTAGPLGLWIGATPLGSGSWVRPPDALLVGGELRAAAALSAEAWRIIAADPLRYITHCLAKIPLAFATSEHPLGQLLVMQPISHKSLILRLMWIPQAATLVLLAAAIAGAVKARRDTLFHMMLAVLLQIIVQHVVRICRSPSLFHDPHPAAAGGRRLSRDGPRQAGLIQTPMEPNPPPIASTRMTKHRIAFLNGSLRKDSFHGRLGAAIIVASADRLDFVTPSLDLPLYNPDLDARDTPAWTEFRDAARDVDGILFGSPEYNRSMTGALKNALDVGSRPYGQSIFSRKPAAVFSGSIGMTGGFGSNHHLRQSCVFLDMPVMPQPEAYWGLLNDEKLPADGPIADETLAKLVTGFADALADWFDLIGGRAMLADDPAHQ